MFWVILLLGMSVVGFSPARGAEGSQPCLSYEPATVTLKGTVSRKTFSGPPNYESVEAGDQPETYWVLRLTKPLCVKGKGDDGQDPDDQPESGVADIQLNLNEDQYAKYRNLVGKEVTVTGSLSHAFTGHHHTAVLLTVTEMKVE